MFNIIIMPKRTSKRKPKKVTKRKTKKVTKRKKRRGRRKFGMLPRMINKLFAMRDMRREDIPKKFTSAPFMDLIDPTGKKNKNTFKNTMDILLDDKKGIKKLFFKGELVNNPKQRTEVFHIVLVAIISMIYQLLNEVDTKKQYREDLQEGKLITLQKEETYRRLLKGSEDEENLSEFKVLRHPDNRTGNVVGFSYIYKQKTIEMSIHVTYNSRDDRLIAETFVKNIRDRGMVTEYPDDLRELIGKYLTIIEKGKIISQSLDNNDNPIHEISGGVTETKSGDSLDDQMRQLTITAPSTNLSETVDDLLDLGGLVVSDTQYQPPEATVMSFTPLTPSLPPSLPPNPPPKKKSEEKFPGNPFDNDDYFFGKRSTKIKRKVSKKKGPSAALKKLCKRLKVKLTTKRGGKRVYKSEKVLKAQCKKAAKKSSFGKPKKKVSKKKVPSATLKKLCKKLKVKLTTKRGGKRVYKSEKVLKAQCKKAAKKSSSGKKKRRKRKFGG